MSSYDVTVLISFYNSSKFIKHKISNLKSQTIFNDCEFIFISGGSKDDKKPVVDFANNHENVKFIDSNKRITIYKAWNKGISNSTAPCICNSNVDDVLAPHALETMRDVIFSGEVSVVFSNIYTTSKPNTNWGEVKGGYINTSINGVTGPFVMWKRDLHEKYGSFDERLWVIGDTEYWNKLRAGKEKFYKISEHLVTYLVGNGMERQKAPDGQLYRMKDARLLNKPKGSVEGC